MTIAAVQETSAEAERTSNPHTDAELSGALVVKIVSFLNSIGLRTSFAPVPVQSFLPGVELIANGLRIDLDQLSHPGDLLHEAGHLAVMDPHRRSSHTPVPTSDGGEEMAAIAWSYAAAVHLGIPAEVVFHEEGYKGAGKALCSNFAKGRSAGVPLLQWMGMTLEPGLALSDSDAAFPRMKCWLRAAEDPSLTHPEPSAAKQMGDMVVHRSDRSEASGTVPVSQRSHIVSESLPVSGLGLEYLQSYWRRILGLAGAGAGSADLDFTLLSGLRLSLHETLQFLHQQRPSFSAFEAWILERNSGAMDPPRLDRLRRALNGENVGPECDLDGVQGLTPEDLDHWNEHGYVVLRNAVSPEQAKAAEMAIYEYLGKSPHDLESWYWGQQKHTIWVSLLRHPAFWAIRNSRRIAKAFAQLWGKDDLWTSVDQGGFNPPERPDWPFPGPHLHWDTTLAEPHHFGVQGILYLADVTEDQGAFTCIPGFHKKLKPWLATLAPNEDPRKIILGYKAKPIAASAGEMVIWHHHLPHGASPNRATRPRVVQYITLNPTRHAHHDAWK